MNDQIVRSASQQRTQGKYSLAAVLALCAGPIVYEVMWLVQRNFLETTRSASLWMFSAGTVLFSPWLVFWALVGTVVTTFRKDVPAWIKATMWALVFAAATTAISIVRWLFQHH